MGGMDSYYAVSPKEMKAKIIFATKITGRNLFQIITEKNPDTKVRSSLIFVSVTRWDLSVFNEEHKMLFHTSVLSSLPMCSCLSAYVCLCLFVYLSIFVSLFHSPPLFLQRGKEIFFLEDRLWRNPGSFDFVTIQVCSCSWCIDKRGPIYLCGPNQSLSSSLVLLFSRIGLSSIPATLGASFQNAVGFQLQVSVRMFSEAAQNFFPSWSLESL